MMLKSIVNEKAILTLISEGNERAFNMLFDFYHHQLGQYVFTITKSIELSEEIVQDVFLKLWQQRITLIQINNIKAYLFILTKNYTLNAIRKQANERKNQQNIENHFLIDSVLEKDSVLENEIEIDSIMERAILNLPSQQQKVYLFRREGMKNAQIASTMSISPNSVKKYLQLALHSIEKFIRAKAAISILICVFFFF